MDIRTLAKQAAGRCWTGYEPVPGKAPYSNDSCRPAGGKKKKTEKKADELSPSPAAFTPLIGGAISSAIKPHPFRSPGVSAGETLSGLGGGIGGGLKGSVLGLLARLAVGRGKFRNFAAGGGALGSSLGTYLGAKSNRENMPLSARNFHQYNKNVSSKQAAMHGGMTDESQINLKKGPAAQPESPRAFKQAPYGSDNFKSDAIKLIRRKAQANALQSKKSAADSDVEQLARMAASDSKCSCGCGDSSSECKCNADCSCRKEGGSCAR